jgi:hypothetical protein
MKRMGRKAAVVMAAGVLASALAAMPAFAQQYPNVATLEPFSAETNFMSLPGYLRWVTFQQTGEWLSMAEATRIVEEQTRVAGN